MKKRRQGTIKCRAYVLLGLWMALCLTIVGVHVQATGSETPVVLEDGETMTALSSDGIYALGGFSYEASEEDFNVETEGLIQLYQWESDALAVSEDNQTDFTAAWEAMTAAIDSYETIVEFPTDSSASDYTISKTEVGSLVNGFLNSHPEFFYVKQVNYVSLTSGVVKRLVFTYTDTPDNLTVMREAYQKGLLEAAQKVDADRMDEAQICAVIHDYLAANCEYEYDETNGNRYNAYGALVAGKAVCQGYALAYQSILNYLGIPCITVGSDDMDHAWNMVRLGESYYHVDVTWDDTFTMPGQVYHNNLLLSKEGIETTGHYGYLVEDAIRDNTADTYMDAYWKHVYSQIYYYAGALYYIYPANETNVPAGIENQSALEQFLFVRQPADDIGNQKLTLVSYNYALLKLADVQPADVVADCLAKMFQRLKGYALLVHDADTWYMNTAYGIYSVDMSEAAMAAGSDTINMTAVYRLPDSPGDETVTFGVALSADLAIINGLCVDKTTLYYQTEEGVSVPVPGLTLLVPEASGTTEESVTTETPVTPPEAPETTEAPVTSPEAPETTEALVTPPKAPEATEVPVTPPEVPAAPPETVQKVQGVMLNYKTLSMKTLNVKTLTAVITPSTAANQNIIWTSSDNSVAKVTKVSGTKKAQVKAVGVGTAVICATTAEGAYVASCKVLVGARSIAKAEIGKIGKKSFSGKAIKPSLTVSMDGVKLKKNRDYKVTYKNNKKVGTATITLKGTGNFTGTVKVTFTIAPKAPVAKVKAGVKSALVTYSKVAGVDGYQIVYAKNRAFTKSKGTINIKQNRIFVRNITGLGKKTVYYFKIRSYKVVNKKKVYSGYYYIGKIRTK